MIEFFAKDVNVKLTFPLKRAVGGKAFDLSGYTAELHSDGLVDPSSPLPCAIHVTPTTGIATLILEQEGLFYPGDHRGQLLLRSGSTILRTREFPISVLDHPVTPSNPP